MAVDSQAKRASAIDAGGAVQTVLPVPDNAMSSDDRQHLAVLYSGISAAVAGAIVSAIVRLRALATAAANLRVTANDTVEV